MWSAHWGRWVEGEFARGMASGCGGRASAWVGGSAGAGRAGNRRGHIPIGPLRPLFLLICVYVGATRLGRTKNKKPPRENTQAALRNTAPRIRDRLYSAETLAVVLRDSPAYARNC